MVKGWCTETSINVTSTGIQVHGGMGFIEETGAAQHFRDARITTIYRGTTAIQANDLIGRKVAREGGSSLAVLLADIDATREQLLASGNAQLSAIGAGAALARWPKPATGCWRTTPASRRKPLPARWPS